jgi:hypothetical protein
MEGLKGFGLRKSFNFPGTIRVLNREQGEVRGLQRFASNAGKHMGKIPISAMCNLVRPSAD